jgi:hypothetical protein
MMVTLRNKNTGEIRSQQIGWSWTCLFFSFFFGIPLFTRKLYGWGAVMALLALLQEGTVQEARQGVHQYSASGAYVLIILNLLPTVLAIVFAATANRMAGRKYLRHGWEFAEPNSEAARIAQQKWGLVTGGGFSARKAPYEIPGLLKPPEPPPLQLPTASSSEIPVATPELVIIGAYDRPVVSGSDYNTRRSYIVRHWQGELSLPVSYWINGSWVQSRLPPYFCASGC